mgnify:CR=1 FL=1
MIAEINSDYLRRPRPCSKSIKQRYKWGEIVALSWPKIEIWIDDVDLSRHRSEGTQGVGNFICRPPHVAASHCARACRVQFEP